MVEFFINMVQFVFQAAVIVVALLVLIAFIASLAGKNKGEVGLEIKDLNRKFNKDCKVLQKKLFNKKEFKKLVKKEKAGGETEKQRVFVLNFKGDIRASAVEQLRHEISAILGVATPKDEVLLRLESPGGMVHSYGLAASQLQRIKDKNIPLIISVDKIAASGGYMMASLADRIISAPFAIIGSIGVVASIPNINKLLKKNDIEYLEITAGEYKRTLTPLGEVTEPGMKKFKEQIEETHILFKNHVKGQREQVDLEKVATGEYWYGLQAKELELVDEIGTSDDYLLNLSDTHSLLEVSMNQKKGLKEKLAESLSLNLEKVFDLMENRIWKNRFQ